MIKTTITSLTLLILLLTGCAMPEGPVPLSGDVPEAEGWETEIVLSGLVHPWSMTWLPEGDMLITERIGQLKLVRDGNQEPELIDGLPEIYVSGQGGLLDISLHPDFEANGLVYLIYSSGNDDGNRTTVGRGILEDQELRGFEEIFRVSDDKTGDKHFGSRMLWLPSDNFLLTIGDGGAYVDYEGERMRQQAQNRATHFGSVLKLTETGNPVDGAPFVEGEDVRDEIWSYGHRNIQGMAFDAENGRIWANEHGAHGGDELNLLKEGANYGWPEVTYSREYHYTKITDKTTKPGMEDPKVVWTPAQAPSGLVYYTGDKFPDWQGDLFSGGLQGEQVRRILLDGESVVGEEKIPIGRRVRVVRQGPDGYLYVLTDHEDGELIRIVPED